eukprot:TRINITY_DN94948_c0_g1_i1.p1 TRINITY_DN94948_c0_g1~~TRINITY_DN94948_c0_g1_i1.p1  ORF type:complete len:480 (+),score=75.70 TRINITY_DN94948_c0_g1_i1:113-1441(+)
MFNNRIRRIDLNYRVASNASTTPSFYMAVPQIETYAGTGVYGFAGDGSTALSAQFRHPCGLAVDPVTDDLYVVDSGNSCIRRIFNGTAAIERFAGLGVAGDSGDGGSALLARMTLDRAQVAVDLTRLVYVSDRGNNRIRVIDPRTGIINGIAGSGAATPWRGGGYAALATSKPFRAAVTFNLPGQLTFPPPPQAPSNAADPGLQPSAFDLYVADEGSHQVRQLISLHGLVRVCAYWAPCNLQNLTGPGARNYGLGAGDRLAVTRMSGNACGRSTNAGGWPLGVRGMPQGGISSAAPREDAPDFSFGAEPVTALPGTYRLCWCSAARGCFDEADFSSQAGVLLVKGPFLGYSRTCHAGQACGEANEVSGIRGVALADGDKMMALTSCSKPAYVIGATGFPYEDGRAHGISLGARQQGTAFSWGKGSLWWRCSRRWAVPPLLVL